jgi:hypothetical protein
LPQPAATNPSTATATATAPVTDRGSPAAGKGNRDTLAELSERSGCARRRVSLDPGTGRNALLGRPPG